MVSLNRPSERAVAQGRASDSRLREPRFESCTAVLKTLAHFFTLHCSSSLSCIHRLYIVVDMFTSSLRAIIVTYGWMLPRELETVLDRTGLSKK